MVDLPLTGACQCGTVTYQLKASPLTLYCCHCTECQHQSSSAFGMTAQVRSEDLAVDWSRLDVWTRRTDSGRQMDCHFCPTCGGRLFHVKQGGGSIVSIKPGSFNDCSWIRPVGHLWLKSRQPWVTIPDGTLAYDGQPDDFGDLYAVWQKETSGLFRAAAESGGESTVS